MVCTRLYFIIIISNDFYMWVCWYIPLIALEINVFFALQRHVLMGAFAYFHCVHAIKIIKIRWIFISLCIWYEWTLNIVQCICFFRVSISLFRFPFPNTDWVVVILQRCINTWTTMNNLLPYFHFKLNSLPECSHFAWQRTLTIAQSVTHPYSGTPIRVQINFNWKQQQ